MEQTLLITISFLIIASASHNTGKFFKAAKLPLISGFIFTGIIAGPSVLGFVGKNAADSLRVVDAIALPFIAFAAGAELNLRILLRKIRGFVIILTSIAIGVISCVLIALLILSKDLPFLSNHSLPEAIAIATMGAIICILASPSSAIAVIKELKARGIFTQTALGTTVLMDAVVILLFAISEATTDIILRGSSISVIFILFLIFEIALNVLFGAVIAQVLRGVFCLKIPDKIKTILLLLCGFVAFKASSWIPPFDIGDAELRIFSEPLLFCMIAGFIIANFTRHRSEFLKTIEHSGTIIFTFFFTALGMALELQLLAKAWLALLLVVFARAIGMYFGGRVGSFLAKEPSSTSRFLGIAFLTQAGLSLGLAKEVAVKFPGWGDEFATFFIAVIVFNTLIGPAFLKLTLHISGEAHLKPEPGEFTHGNRVMIFGVEDQSLQVARNLSRNGWKVTLTDTNTEKLELTLDSGIITKELAYISPEILKEMGMDRVGTIITMLDSETNYKIAEIAQEKFGVPNIIVRLNDGAVSTQRFKDLGVSLVDPGSALVNLLEHYARSPSAASIILGEEENQDVIEVRVANPAMQGRALRDLKLPSDILILAIRRRGQLLVSHGYNRLRIGDRVTIVGKPESLKQIESQLTNELPIT